MHEIKPELPERQPLAEMTKHHLQFWEPVEDPLAMIVNKCMPHSTANP
jgi:hypothetical protein